MIRKLLFYFFSFLLFCALAILSIHFHITTLKTRDLPIFHDKRPENVKLHSEGSTYLSADNVNFRFNDKLNILLKNVNGELVTIKRASILNLDDVNSFKIIVNRADAFVSLPILEILIRDYVFNYPDSPLKLESMEFLNSAENKLKVKGELKFLIWIPFEMIARLTTDSDKTKIVIVADKITALGNPYSKNLLESVGLNLDKLIQVPGGRGLIVSKNKVILSPFELFPPPKLDGRIASLEITNGLLHLTLDNNRYVQPPQMPNPVAKNFLFLFNGEMKFAKLVMIDTSLQLIDRDDSDVFDFYLEKYLAVLSNGGIATIGYDRSLKVLLPDYNDVFPKNTGNLNK